MSIYQEVILDHYRNPRNFGPLESFTHVSNKDNPLCGDKIEIAIRVDNNIIKDIKFNGSGCAISIAASSILTEKVKGKSIQDLRKIDKSYILDELGIELSPNRLKCALLPLEVLNKLCMMINH